MVVCCTIGCMFRVLPLTTRVLACVLWLAAESLRAAEPYGLAQRAPIGPYLNNHLPEVALVQTGNWLVVEAFPNLPVDDPLMMAPEPGVNRLCVASRQGQILSFENNPAVSNAVEF